MTIEKYDGWQNRNGLHRIDGFVLKDRLYAFSINICVTFDSDITK